MYATGYDLESVVRYYREKNKGERKNTEKRHTVSIRNARSKQVYVLKREGLTLFCRHTVPTELKCG